MSEKVKELLIDGKIENLKQTLDRVYITIVDCPKI